MGGHAMKMRSRMVASGIAFALVGALVGTTWAAAGARLVAVVNASNRTKSISSSDLREMFLGRSRFWDDGMPVQLFSRPEGSEADLLLLRDVLHMTPARLRHHWQELALSGRGTAPEVVYSPGELARKVAREPGAISYMTASEAVNLGPGVRVVPVN